MINWITSFNKFFDIAIISSKMCFELKYATYIAYLLVLELNFSE